MRHTHHIIPKWLGGTDDWWNLESVTIKEHFIIHLRIARFLNTASSWRAVNAILNSNPSLGLFRKYWFKRFGNAQKGKNNPMYGKNSEDYMTDEAINVKRQKQSEAKIGKNNYFYCKNKGMNNGFYGKTHTINAIMNQKDKICKFLYHTPEGSFISSNDAAKANNCSRYIVSNRCKSKEHIKWSLEKR